MSGHWSSARFGALTISTRLARSGFLHRFSVHLRSCLYSNWQQPGRNAAVAILIESSSLNNGQCNINSSEGGTDLYSHDETSHGGDGFTGNINSHGQLLVAWQSGNIIRVLHDCFGNTIPPPLIRHIQGLTAKLPFQKKYYVDYPC